MSRKLFFLIYLRHFRTGSPAIHEPIETSILDIHSLTGLFQKTLLNSATGIIIMLVYDHGGYRHPVHPVDSSVAPADVRNKTNQLLEIYSQAVQIIRRNISQHVHHIDTVGPDLPHAVYYRFDRMEEKNFEELDTLHRLHLTADQLPAVVMFKGINNYF